MTTLSQQNQEIYQKFINGEYVFNTVHSIDLQKIALARLHERTLIFPMISMDTSKNMFNTCSTQSVSELENHPEKIGNVKFGMDDPQYNNVLTGREFNKEQYYETFESYDNIFGDKYDNLFVGLENYPEAI